MNKCPLAYVARLQVAAKPHGMDHATDYEKVDKEMTSRAPHDHYVYGADSKTLRNILQYSLKDHPSCTSIMYFTRTQNGRAAYLALTLHSLGESLNYTVLEEAEDNLKNVFYT